MNPAIRSSLVPVEFPSSVESPLVRPDQISHPLGSLSSSLTPAHSGILPKITLVPDAHVTTRMGTLSMEGDIRNVGPNFPMEAFGHGHDDRSVLSTSGVVEHTSTPGGNWRD